MWTYFNYNNNSYSYSYGEHKNNDNGTFNVLVESHGQCYENIPMLLVLWIIYCALGILIISSLTTIYLSITHKQELNNEIDLEKQYDILIEK